MRHAWRDADGHWQTETIDDTDGRFVAVELGPDGTLHAAWERYPEFIYASRPEGGEWHVELVPGLGPKSVDLHVDDDGTPHVVATSWEEEGIRYAYRRSVCD